MSKKKTPYLKEYYMQKAAAKQRSVPFELTFEEWREWWGEDVDKRGRNSTDAMVMGLIRPELGYRLDNIEKRTKGEHSLRNTNPNKSWGPVRPIVTPHGEFPSISQAAKFLDMYTMTVRNRCMSKNFKDWYFKNESEG